MRVAGVAVRLRLSFPWVVIELSSSHAASLPSFRPSVIPPGSYTTHFSAPRRG